MNEERVKLLTLMLEDINESNLPRITKMWLNEYMFAIIKPLLKQESTEETK